MSRDGTREVYNPLVTTSQPVGSHQQVPFWGPYNKDYNILGSILGSPHFWKLPYSKLREGGLYRGLSNIGFRVQDLGFRVSYLEGRGDSVTR